MPSLDNALALFIFTMAQKTSWNGSLTKAIRARGYKNAYTRYRDRRNKSGLEIVVPHDTHLEILDGSGRFIRNEVKYNHVNSDEVTAKNTYRTQVKKQYNAYMKRLRRK
mgnify:CR=1 FL=1